MLQVVEGTTTTYASSTSATYADTNLTATITPSSNTSKILVLVSQQASASGNNSNHGMVGLRLLRGATTIQTMDYMQGLVSNAFTLGSAQSLLKLDSPNTTSAVTYKTQFARPTGVGEAQVNNGADASTIVLMEIGA